MKSLDVGFFFYTGRSVDAVAKVPAPALKTMAHIPSVSSRQSLKDKEREARANSHQDDQAQRTLNTTRS